MVASWEGFENRVRLIAQRLWSKPCLPAKVGGVNVDGVVQYTSETWFLIEITENRTLPKVREDVIKLLTAKSALYGKNVFAKCYCVVNGSVTSAMKEAGEPHHISVLTASDFEKLFFDFEIYHDTRLGFPFGSSINPITGEIDQTKYIQVKYDQDGSKRTLSIDEICDALVESRNVIVLGEYGTGKSRCVREVFVELGKRSNKVFVYPIAINLRNSWGLTRYSEMIRRHFSDLGLENLEGSAVRAFNTGSLAVLLDGFDEIGSQAWSKDTHRLKAIRGKALEGVKHLISETKAPVLISGREHYFTNDDEMFQLLGLDRKNTIVLRCKTEFSDTQLLEYFYARDIDVEIPDWLPRRPLICQTISTLAAEQFAKMFLDESGEIAFWNHFLMVLCRRDAAIHVSFDADVIFKLLVRLSRYTRPKPSDVGPITLSELQSAFEAVTGFEPVEEASALLQRLVCLGRISSESNDRQFVDKYILDGLRAKDVVQLFKTESEFLDVATHQWKNPLEDLGQRILSADTTFSETSKLKFAKVAQSNGNHTLSSDIVGSLLREADGEFDFQGINIDNGEFSYFALSERKISNLTLSSCLFWEIAFPLKGVRKVKVQGGQASKVSGISSPSALPAWIRDLAVEQFDSVENVARIRRAGLSAEQVILITIIRKTFFQRGGGRKEEALLRGLGKIASRSAARRILNEMLREGLLSTFGGDGGNVYVPNRGETKRMQAIMDELKLSKDPLWDFVS